jgi:hypothetical protein
MKKTHAVIVLVSLAACTGRGPRDIGNQNKRSEFEGSGSGSGSSARDAGDGRVLATPQSAGKKARILAHASARAIATNATHVFYGDAEDDTLFAVPKKGGDAVRIARRAPMPGALSVDGTTLAWIATPGDVIFRVATNGGTPTTVRDRGIFTDVLAGGGDVFFTEATGRGGSLTRVTGTTASRLATFEGSPRGIALDATHAYAATATKLVAVPRLRNEPHELAAAVGFASPQVDDHFVYATATVDGNHAVVRVAKTGGSLEVVVRDVRAAPIAIHNGTLAWFDGQKPLLLARVLATGGTRTLAEDAAFQEAVAITLDDDGAFIAAGDGADALVMAIDAK